ncbi:homodimeric glycerol 3-phosphate dehydrogenase (quinone) [Gemmobacter aquatilis]|uniref:Glycerol-3-phosphate dehydrogenase n=1 Tax=Gemmobacter aquatilis TaxID=933059 RepID=A0A1H7Y9H0_9RHOB|nr:glycerol-3-phosphate dehydrogenase [Gemmobacter aquatilis]SEM42551.1 homodimeric glycerol 3-phosphate dehydrogenase (quinone) [Gemmobacter aquatilis]
MAERIFDLAIIGGGINGCGIARDAVGRGLSVFLCEQGDLGGATSSASTKLLHGGLRYLEHYEFRLVREALIEREVLWGIAPQIVRPLRFVLPHSKGMRPAWLLRLGLFIYDHLGGRKLLPGTSRVAFHKSPLGEGLRRDLTLGFEYSDCWVEDNRLVILNAQDAQERGAVIRVGTKCTAATALPGGGWRVVTRDLATGVEEGIQAKVLINAAGPWANAVARDIARRPPKGKVRQVQGSHIVVPRLYAHDRCFIFQNKDGRIVFTIPYEDRFTLIGTTDRDYPGDPRAVRASDEEIAYLCKLTSDYFQKPVTPADVVWTYSGVRPLYDDGSDKAQKATRDYVLELDDSGSAPMISVFGGKITTYRRLAEAVMDKLAPLLGAQALRGGEGPGWTGRRPLPGGDFAPGGFMGEVNRLREQYRFLAEDEARRFVRHYGSRAGRVLGSARSWADMGIDFGAGLTSAEVDYMRGTEWVRTAEDILFRRSKLGLRMTAAQIAALEAYLDGGLQRQSA